jgi:hypothetical protein
MPTDLDSPSQPLTEDFNEYDDQEDDFPRDPFSSAKK